MQGGAIVVQIIFLVARSERNLFNLLRSLVPPARIELAAHGLGIHCSIH